MSHLTRFWADIKNKELVNIFEQTRPGDSGAITRRYLDSILLEMRLIDSDLPSTQFTLFGNTFDTPVMTAALSHLNSTHPDGMVELARGAKAANAVMWAGMGDDAELAAIVETGAKTIKIVKPYKDNEEILRKIWHSEQCGAMAVGMDIDHAFSHDGAYDVVLGSEMRPKSLAEIKSFVDATRLPFIIKGVLSVQDARKCLEAGVAGIVISHHHGIMDYAVPTLKILPEIAAAVAGKMQIFVDCNIESGYDTLKALALGAQAVSVGRALIPPLGKAGASSVCDAIRAINAQLAFAMAMTGSSSLSSIDASALRCCSVE